MSHTPMDPAQRAVQRARLRLLQGRGPDAGEREVARNTRDRTEVGGVPVPALLEATAAQAAATRGDVTALADRVTRERARFATDVSAVRRHVRESTRHRARGTGAFVVGVLVGWLLRSRRGRRSTGGPPASHPDRAPRARRRRRTRST